MIHTSKLLKEMECLQERATMQDLKNADEVERRCSTENEPVFETKILTDDLKDIKA